MKIHVALLLLVAFGNCHCFNSAAPPAVRPTLAHTVPAYGNSMLLGIAQLRDDLFVTRSRENFISVFDASSMRIKRRFIIPGFEDWNYGLAVCPYNNYLYLSDYHGGRAYIHRINLPSYTNITSWTVPTNDPQLSVNNAHNLLVIYDTGIHEYTPSGAFIRQLGHERGVFYAVETKNGTMVVSRNRPIVGIEELTWDGQISGSIGVYGSGQNQFNEPKIVALTSDGYILVADRGNSRIQVVNPSRTSARTLPLPTGVSLSYPGGLVYDESRGRLFVGETSGNRRLLVFDNVTNLSALFG